LSAPPPEAINPETAPLGVDDDDDDYDPDFYNAEDTEQIMNKLDNAPPEAPVEPKATPEVTTLGPFTLPPPPPLTLEQATKVGQGTVSRVFGVMQTLEEPGKKSKSGMNRLAASAYDRDAWITIITRLATRAAAGLEEQPEPVKVEHPNSTPISLNNTIRDSLYHYVLEDFRKRIDIAVAWLCEEWYNDKIQMKFGEDTILHYEKWVIKVLDGIVPYLDARDKVLTRFLSEIPGLSTDVLERVKSLCRDPAMVNLALTSLLYLVMMRPPVREIALDAVEDVWNKCKFSSFSTHLTWLTHLDDDAKPMAAKYLTKWRPGFAERLKGPDDQEKKANGVAAAA
jgi:symplekin